MARPLLSARDTRSRVMCRSCLQEWPTFMQQPDSTSPSWSALMEILSDSAAMTRAHVYVQPCRCSIRCPALPCAQTRRWQWLQRGAHRGTCSFLAKAEIWSNWFCFCKCAHAGQDLLNWRPACALKTSCRSSYLRSCKVGGSFVCHNALRQEIRACCQCDMPVLPPGDVDIPKRPLRCTSIASG